MPYSICRSCQSTLRLRFQQKISKFQNTRRARSTGRKSHPLDSWYWDTLPPNSRQLAAASHFFHNHHPRKVWTANEWQAKQKNNADSETLTPEVAFLGRSNVGKSSLLNALLNSPFLNKVGSKPGKTKVVHAYGLFAASIDGRRKGLDSKTSAEPVSSLVTVLDAPGYGHGSQNDWGESVIKYLKQRKQLRRIFVLINAQHGILQNDLRLLKLLREETVSHEVIATKCDRLEPPSTRQEQLKTVFETIRNFVQPQGSENAFTGLGEILSVGWIGDGKLNTSVQTNDMQGVSAVQWAILCAAGLDQYALKQFNELPQAKGYDDSPMKPNAVRRSAGPKTLLDKITASPSKTRSDPEDPLPGSLPPPKSRPHIGPGSEFDNPSPPWVSRGMDSRPSAIKPSQGQIPAPVSQGMEGLLTALDQGKRRPTPLQRQAPRSRSLRRSTAKGHQKLEQAASIPLQQEHLSTRPSGPVSHGMEGLLSALDQGKRRSTPAARPQSRMARKRAANGAQKYDRTAKTD